MLNCNSSRREPTLGKERVGLFSFGSAECRGSHSAPGRRLAVQPREHLHHGRLAKTAIGATLCSLLLGGLLAPSGAAQERLWWMQGADINSNLGWAVDFAGDVNADGVQDFILGSPSYTDIVFGDDCIPIPVPYARAAVHSGVDGSQIHQFSYAPKSGFGAAVSAAGDIDLDGYDDVIIGAPGVGAYGSAHGNVWVYSGFNKATLFIYGGVNVRDLFGTAVRGIGDVNSDGHPDFAIGAPNELHNGIRMGSVRVYSGSDGTVLHELFGETEASLFGTVIDSVGDMNGDGVPDFVTSAAGALLGGVKVGRATVHSGLDASVIYEFFGNPSGSLVGSGVAGAGDVNGDGIDDVIVSGAEPTNPFTTSVIATVYSGFDGAVLHEFTTAVSGDHYGCVVSRAGDINHDGYDDLLLGRSSCGHYVTGIGTVRVLSGLDGSVLRFFSDVWSRTFGNDVRGGTDINQDGTPDIIVGSREGGGFNSGEAMVYSGAPLPTSAVKSYCQGDGGDQSGCSNCPCGNNAPAGSPGGCLNSRGTDCRLIAQGTGVAPSPFWSTDYLRLFLTGAPPATLCLLFTSAGVASTGPCLGNNSGVQSFALDGLRCTVAGARRSGEKFSDANGQIGFALGYYQPRAWDYLEFNDQGLQLSGQTVTFQVIYRDDPTAWCQRGLNSSQAIEVVFEP